MAIRDISSGGKVSYEVSVSVRSKTKPKLRVQMLRRGIPTLRQAQQIEKELIRETALELSKREEMGSRWGEIIEKWEQYQRNDSDLKTRIQISTIMETVATLNRFTVSWTNLICQDISPAEIRRVLMKMESEGYSRSRIKAVKSSVNVIFKWGIEQGLIDGLSVSPAQGVTIKKRVDDKPPQILTLAEIHRLMAEAKKQENEWYPIWAVALNTGMRSGELFALEWNDIDLENRLITVSKSYNARIKTVKSTKAGYWRKVPINSDLEEILIDLRQKFGSKGHVLPRVPYWERGEAALVLRNFCANIGIREVHFHALRACFATHLLNAGVSSPIVKKICGWTDEKVMTRYIRLAGVDVSGATLDLNFMKADVNARKVETVYNYRITNKKVRASFE